MFSTEIEGMPLDLRVDQNGVQIDSEAMSERAIEARERAFEQAREAREREQERLQEQFEP